LSVPPAVHDLRVLLDAVHVIPRPLVYETVSEFNERVRRLPNELTGLPNFSYEHIPHLRAIADSLSANSAAEEIIVMKSAGIGYTTAVLEAVILYNIACRPCPQLFVTGTMDMAKKAVYRIDRMIEDSGCSGLIRSQRRKSARSRTTGNTEREKEYKGGFLHVVGAQSGSQFRGNQYLAALCDEADAYIRDIKGEGNIFTLIRNRTNAYPGRRKILSGSTPTITQTSLIYEAYCRGDRQKYFVPCIHCGTMQELVWYGAGEDGKPYGITWENDDKFRPILETVAYRCPHCGGLMKNEDKRIIVPAGEWRPTYPPEEPPALGVISFHVSALYNMPGMLPWEDLVKEWTRCWDIEKNRVKDREEYRAFRNTRQGLPFEETGTGIRYERVVQFKRAGFIEGKVPNRMAQDDSGSPVLILIASADVQKDRIYVDVKGYSDNGVTWTIDFFDIQGPTEQYGGPWVELEHWLLSKVYEGDDGRRYHVAAMYIDSGFFTDYVYAFVQRLGRLVFVVKGVQRTRSGETFTAFSEKYLVGTGVPVAYNINTTKMKDRISDCMTVLQWHSREHQPQWYPNFPEGFRDDYFRMFESEYKREKREIRTNRYLGTEWYQRKGVPNHALDTYAYNLAGLEIFAFNACQAKDPFVQGINWAQFWAMGKRGEFFEGAPVEGH
jgi:phage terminase large subunit GpA-like protein